MSQVKSGTVDVTNSSQTVSGNGTTWLSDGVEAGHSFIVQSEGIVYDIASVDSNTQITLAANYAGSTASDVAYVIATDFTPNKGYPELERGDLSTAAIFTRAMREIDEDIGGLGSSASVDTGTGLTQIPLNEDLQSGISVQEGSIGSKVAVFQKRVFSRAGWRVDENGILLLGKTDASDGDRLGFSGMLSGVWSEGSNGSNRPGFAANLVFGKDINGPLTASYMGSEFHFSSSPDRLTEMITCDYNGSNWIGIRFLQRSPDDLYVTGDILNPNLLEWQGVAEANVTNIQLYDFFRTRQFAGNGDIYTQNSILGTVSQSNGVPTGAIIERGSNANGEYVMMADGSAEVLQEVTIDLTVSAYQDFSYPITLVGKMSSSLSVQDGSGLDEIANSVVENNQSAVRISLRTTGSGTALVCFYTRGFWY